MALFEVISYNICTKLHSNYVVDYIAKTYNNNKRMSCKQYGFTIQGDVNSKLEDSVNAIAGSDYTKLQILAGYFGTEEFARYVEQQGETREYLSINGNTMRKLLGSFFVSNHNSVNNSVNKKNANAINGFNTARAKTIAKDHTANLIIENYYSQLNNNEGVKFNRRDIITNVTKQINKSFNKIANDIIDKINVEDNKSKSNNLILDSIKTINANINDLFDEYDNIFDILEANPNIENASELNDRLDNLDELIDKQESSRYVLYQNLVDKIGNIREKNFANLTSKVRGDANEWYKNVFDTSKLVNLADEFNTILENEKLIERNYVDENDVVNVDSDSVDEMAKSWEDALYGSFDRHVGSKLKVYLNRLYNMSSPTPMGSTEYQFDTNNELGVPTTMGANFIITQISNYANFNSVNDFINSVSKASQINPSLYGLSKLVNDMTTNTEFANQVFQQLNNPKIAKTVVTISENDITFDQNNKSADALSHLVYQLLNSAKATYKNSFSISDREENLKYQKAVNDAKDANIFYNGSTIKSIDNFIVDTLIKYFPKIDKQAIYNHLKSDPSNVKDIYKEFLQNLNILSSSVESVVDDYNSKWGQYLTEYGKWANKKRIADDIGEVFNTAMPIFDYSSINYDKLNSPVINIAKRLVNYTAVKNELNSINAEGNMASDLIGNSYITNFIKQIAYGNEDNINAGLNNLKDFITKSPQYQYSPFYFGVKDSNGNLLSPGLFDRDNTGNITINPNAKSLINISLFDGAKDRNNAKSTMYSGMSRGDYFLTQLVAFNTPIKYITQDSNSVPNAGYFMRTPSDAPKNFIVQAPKYDVSTLWKVINSSRTQYINDIQDELRAKYNFTNEGQYLTLSDNIITDNVSGKLTNNIMNANDIYDMLKNPIDNKVYNNLYNQYDAKTNKVTIPIIYKKDGEFLIVYLEGDKALDTNNNIAENIQIKEIHNPGNIQDGVLPYDFLIDISDTLTKDGIDSGRIDRTIDKNNPSFRALYNHTLGEVNNFINNLNNVFEKKSGKYISKTSTLNLIDRAHYNNNEIVKDGKLTGNFFNFIRLFETNGYKAGEDLMSRLFLYGGVNEDQLQSLLTVNKGGKLSLNTNRTDLINTKNGKIELNISEENSEHINSIVEQWLNNYYKETLDRTEQYNTILEDKNFSNNDIINYTINNAIMEMNFDDIFEGDTKFYKSAQDFLKRAKEVQAAGKSYAGFDFKDSIGGPIHNITDEMGYPTDITVGDKIIGQAKNGFKAVTIYNTIRPSKNAGQIKEELVSILKDKLGNTEANRIATEIGKGYFDSTKTNDAQSYITLEEFIARRHADGTLSEYQDLLSQLLDDNIMTPDINLKGINSRIQVQKNFYFDKQFDENTGTYYPRQIKNAEFVLIPKLIKGTHLEDLYNVMKGNGIDQINTAETSKAAKKNILTFWDNNGVVNADQFNKDVQANNKVAIEDYYYQYLYKQQDVADHMINETNKAGIQVMKKIIDNANADAQGDIDNFFKNYVSNIQDDFNMLLSRMGWKSENGFLVDGTGKVNGDGNPVLQFSDFYKKARIEAQRLGMDSNFIEYLTEDAFGQPTMPNYMNNVSSKLESIAQSIFNNGITRQTLPGWHAAQVTSVGHGVPVLGENGQWRDLKYHPQIKNEDGTIKQEAYAEVMLPRWSSLIPKDYDLNKLSNEGLDIHLGYRIPTEGKQSISVLKVVGFLDDVYGSTIMLPDEWVTQTGSDFDVDSVYGISYKMYKDQDNILKKIPFDDSNTEEAVQNRYNNYIKNVQSQSTTDDIVDDPFNESKRNATNLLSLEEFAVWSIEDQNSRDARNNRILDSMINIMNNVNSREENYSRSNFDDLTSAMKKMNKLRGEEDLVRSTYNPLDQIDFMENAMSGATLKAFSVTRDTFNSVNNYTKSKLGEGHNIKVEYDLSKYNINNIKSAYDNVIIDKSRNVAIVTHDRLGNSNNNRNVVGKLLTVYSSQTTAHILDAVKEGTIYNENDYTFGAFKTLVDIGIDYDTAVAFLMQPGVTKINDAYFSTKSIYTNTTLNPINSAIKSIATDLGITIGGKQVDAYTPIKLVIQRLSSNPGIQEAYRQLFGATVGYNKGIDLQDIALNGTMLQNRLNKVEIVNNNILSSNTKQYRDAAFDLAMINNFSKYYNTSRNIENLARVSNPDRFGAKQTIRSTRTTLQNIVKYASDPSDKVGSTILVNGIRLIDTLYPGVGTGAGIQVDQSSYPYLAAFLKYATQPSVEANSQLFPTESYSYNAITDTVQARLGINFTDDQYKEYKQYMMSNVYSAVPFMTTPLTLNDFGQITLDNKTIENQTENNDQYWDKERNRIFGYDVVQSSNLEINDINNPTEEEINKFNQLTPAQKVMWIQSNFNDDRGVFDFLDVNLFNQNEYKQKGFTGQSIKYSDQVDDIEDIYVAFRDSFFNKNPLVRLASVDLIKYAFIVEGFKFKKGGISKIITNDSLYSNLEDKGINAIEAIQQQFMIYNNPLENTTQRFIDKFIRSHSEIVKEVSIPKAKRDKQGNENIGWKFTRQMQGENIIHIPFEEATKELLEHLTIGEGNPKGYLRITKWINDKQRRTTLYKIINNITGVYLTPMNLLERNETSEYSSNPRNNIYKAPEYYNALIDLSTENGTPINELLKDRTTLDQINILKDQFTITKQSHKHIVETVENRNELIRVLNNGNDIERVEVNKLVKDVINYTNSPVEESSNYGVIRNDSRYISSLIPKGTSIIQNIPIGDDIITVKISNYTKSNGLSKQFGLVLNNDRKGDISQVKPEELSALNNSIDAKSLRPTLYKIERVSNEEDRQNYEDLKKQVEDEANNQMNAVTNLIEDFDVDVAYNYTDTDKVAKDIFNELNKRALSNDDKRASKFKKGMDIAGVDRTSATSIHDNKKNIYVAAAKYYTERSHELLSNIDKFTGINGEQYSIDDPTLYKHLTEYQEDYPLLVKLVLDAKTFGDQFYDIFNLNIDGEDDITTKSIEKIKNAINNVRTNSKLKNGVNLIFNDYIANNWSTNPLVRHGLIDLKTTFGDTDWFDLQFSDVQELNHKQVQAVVKQVNSILNEAKMFIAPKSIETFDKQREDILARPGEYNEDNFITKQGKFISPYTEQFIEDRNKLVSDFKVAKDNIINDPLGYHKAKLARDKWRAKNLQQEVVSPYYNENNNLVENILKQAPKEYVKYMDLIDQLYNNTGNIASSNKEEKDRRKDLNNQIRNITSDYNDNNELKSEEERYRGNQLKKYIDTKKILNKEYFNYDESDGFKDTLEYYTSIIKQYEKKHPLETLDQKLADSHYKEAYDWVQGNTIYTLNPETQKIISDAFAALKSKDGSSDNTAAPAIKKILKDSDAYDSYGNIDARKLTAEQIKQIKNLTAHKFSWGYESNAGEAILIKDVPAGLPVLKDSFYRMLRGDNESISNVNVERIKTIGEINKLLSKAVDGNTGQINSKDLFDKLTEEELSNLGTYYRVLHNIKGDRDNVALAKKFKANVEFKTNDEAFNREWTYAQSNLKSTKQFDTWLNIFVQTDKNGEYILDDNNKFIANSDIFGYVLPKDKTYVDEIKTNARNTVENDIEYVPNEYYYSAIKEATAQGKFNEWYNDNHIFNPYTHKMEPLKVWTSMQVNPNGKLNGSYSYAPTYENTERTVKDEYLNHNQKQYSTNYNIESGQYNNLTKLTPKEKDMLDLYQGTINAHASTHAMRMFAEQGYLPRRAKYVNDSKWYGSQLIGSLGLEFRNTNEKQWTDQMDYTHDFDADFPMMSLIKQKGYKEHLKIDTKGTRESDEEYTKRVEDIRTQNKAIDAENLKLDNELLDTDWKNVFHDFIGKASEYNAKQRSKNTLYLLLEDLKDSPAFKESTWNKSLKRDNSKSTREQDAYQTTNQTNTHNLVQNYLRRLLFDQFKKSSPYSQYADLAQNITSAKYMIANVTGGIANVATGMANVFGEVFANDYFGKEDFIKGQSQYFQNSLSFLSDMYSHETNNPTVGLTKFFDIVEFNAFHERRPDEKATEHVKRVRDALYSMQSGGEHYMQNSVLLTILKSNRVFKDSDGQMRVGSIANYNWELETQTLMGMLNGKEDLLTRYKSFLKDIKGDLNELRKYDSFSRDFNEEFLRDIGDKDLIKEYINKRKEVLANSEVSFKSNPTVEDQFELHNGHTHIKEDSPLTEQMVGELKQKVVSINKKIHGVYDKIGAASIEKEWWGGLVMQYHKHMYPGIMKRYRTKGYYNESRSSIERGSYISLANYLGTEFRNIGERINDRVNVDNENKALASFQEVIKSSIDTVLNFKLNYQLMPVWEQNNMRRALGDLLGITSAFMLAMAIHLMTDDDEIKQSELLSTALYMADRLNSESAMFTPTGVFSEAKTLWSSPIAAQNGPIDLFKGLGIATSMLFEADYNPNYTTGLYKGQNKLAVLAYRNTPAYRIYQRLTTMTKNNSYYKINQNALNIKYAKALADKINPDK